MNVKELKKWLEAVSALIQNTILRSAFYSTTQTTSQIQRQKTLFKKLMNSKSVHFCRPICIYFDFLSCFAPNLTNMSKIRVKGQNYVINVKKFCKSWLEPVSALIQDIILRSAFYSTTQTTSQIQRQKTLFKKLMNLKSVHFCRPI